MAQIDNRRKKINQDPEIKQNFDEILNDNEPIVEPPKEYPEEEGRVEESPKSEQKQEEPQTQEEEHKEDKPQVEKPKIESDYEEKYKREKEKNRESAREAMVLWSKNKKLNETIMEAANLGEPTEDELMVYAHGMGAKYEELDDFTKNVLKEQFLSKKKFDKIYEVSRESKKLDEWVDNLDKFLENEETANKYPALIENAEDFKAFCLRGKRPYTDLEDLVPAFLYQYESKPKKHYGELLLSGGNGQVEPARPKGVSEDDLADLRQSDLKEYMRAVKLGKHKNIEI